MRPVTFLVLAMLFLAIHGAAGPLTVAELGITVSGTSREYCFTNKESAFLYGETIAPNKSSWHGLTVTGRKFLDDWSLETNGRELLRDASVSAVVCPDRIVRTYPGAIVETIQPLDGVSAIVLTVTAPEPVEIVLRPWLADGRRPEDFVIRSAENAVLLARPAHLAADQPRDAPRWLAVGGEGVTAVADSSVRGRYTAPVMLRSPGNRKHVFVIAVGTAEEATSEIARDVLRRADSLAERRRNRMDRLLSSAWIRTNNPHFDRALAWATLSADALVMNQGGKGIFAGLPWFNNYWGRDTFISLPGATLVTGQWEEARDILRSFATHQQRDSLSTDFGRIPNYVGPAGMAYNTADGTPRFIIMAHDYVVRSGDSSFMKEIYPVVIRSIEGAMRYRVDSLGFLTHADAESWMDASGPAGPWSPRGNRANDVQALWEGQLSAGEWFAARLGDITSARRWHDVRLRLRRNFLRLYPTDGGLVDHLNADGSADTQIRPNQLFAASILPDSVRVEMLRSVVTRLTYEYGVASLAPSDSNFHPFHVYPPFYPKDAAYHNGVVWTWLQGPLISELCRHGAAETAFAITQTAADVILNRGAVGTLPELLDAIPRAGEAFPRGSGTVSQAWSVAEFLRNAYEDYLGIRVNGYNDSVTLAPQIPAELGEIHARVRVRGGFLGVSVSRDRETRTVTLDGRGLGQPIEARIQMPAIGVDESYRAINERVAPGSVLMYKFMSQSVSAVITDSYGLFVERPVSHSGVRIQTIDSSALDFLKPELPAGLRALRGPNHPLVPHSIVRSRKPPGATTLVSAKDPFNDDVGLLENAPATPAAYSYPKSPNFRPGSFDLGSVEVTRDSMLAYFTLVFRALSDPGWHPEYGFQLTIAAIAIDFDGRPGSGRTMIGRNAGFPLPSLMGYERIVFVGGGVEIEDASGSIIASYTPLQGDAADPIGDASSGTIRFAVPLKYLGPPWGPWTVYVVAGAQDDHGGAGLGEFRAVQAEASEWNGGGRRDPDDSNVYDLLIAGQRR